MHHGAADGAQSGKTDFQRLSHKTSPISNTERGLERNTAD
jgi:hypothetical protein